MTKKLPKITIAIDGYSSTGKSTVAKELAKALGYIYVDSGAMYRAVTHYALQHNLISSSHIDKQKIVDSLTSIHIVFKLKNNIPYLFLNDKNVEKEIRSMHVSGFVSEVSTIPEVRSYLVDLQREMGKNKGVIMDGRDIGTVVFPDAELKVFLTADAQVRAERRLLELQQKGEPTDFESIYQNVVERDRIDSTREVSPLTKAADAVEIDVTHINKEQQFQRIYELATERILNKNLLTKE